jgi:hypothetical protein
MVTINQLRELYYAKPFQPFVLVLDDGRCVRIKEPIYISYSEEARTVAFPLGGSVIGWTSFDRVSRIEIETVKQKRGGRKAS